MQQLLPASSNTNHYPSSRFMPAVPAGYKSLAPAYMIAVHFTSEYSDAPTDSQATAMFAKAMVRGQVSHPCTPGSCCACSRDDTTNLLLRPNAHLQSTKSDGGWTLEIDDLRAVLEQSFDISLAEDTEMLQRLFKTMDTNGVGVITQEEWVRRLQAGRRYSVWTLPQ